jgi:hypothetical protein
MDDEPQQHNDVSDLIPAGNQSDKKLDPRKVNFNKIKVASSTFARITNPIFEQHQVQYLQRRTPNAHIYDRPGKGNQTFYYITAAFVIKSLNILFGYNWSFEIKSFDIKGKQCLVHGRLTGTVTRDSKDITIYRESFGRADIKLTKGDNKPLDLGNDLKAAESDCLKRCYRQLGGALDVFATNEYAEIILTDDAGEELDPVKEAKIREAADKAREDLVKQREDEKAADNG